MAWPGRGPGASRGSQAWMFATPEEMLGRRVIRDDTIWDEPPAHTALEASSREFTTRAWDFGAQSESRCDSKNDQNKNVKAAAPPVQMHNKVKAAEKAGPEASSRVKRKTDTSRNGENDDHTDIITVKGTDLAPLRVQIKCKGMKLQQKKSQEIPSLIESNKVVGRDTHNKANEKFRQLRDTSAKKKAKKNKTKKAGSNKAIESATYPDASGQMDCKGSQAQKTADSPLTTVIERESNGKHDPHPPKPSCRVIALEIKDSKMNIRKPELLGTTNTKASVQECVSTFELVKETVSRYCMQSAAHSALHIDVQLAASGHQPNNDAATPQLNVTLQNYSQKFIWLCKRCFRKGRATRKVMVCTDKYPVPLQRLLAEHFPVSGAMTSGDTLRQFWNANGKSFNWTGLPTELKEHIIQFCIVTAPKHPDNFHDTTSVDRLSTIDKRSCELIDRLSRWKSLLRVSIQVRALALRLCFNGSLIFDKGLCMTSYSLPNLSGRISQLEHFSQIAEPNSTPLHPDGSRRLLAVVYRDAPKIYPELKRYGDFSQGVRKVDISFDFISFYRFFQVTAGEFGKDCLQRCTLSCNVFEKMPQLNEIIVRLPANRKKTWVNKTHQMERPLFDITSPCPRMIFRILYERIAEALAAYDNVSVKNFLDEHEEERFWGLRQTKMKALQDTPAPEPFKLTVEELQEISTPDGGGIHLTPSEIMQVRQERYERLALQLEKKDMERQLGSLVQDETAVEEFYPIRCQCFVPCQERYGFYPSL
ncbi:hypothetical protein PMIN06_001464 [Paraphaeosphaeria minitans]|uniref:Uncharacterized protein n=1 Tax=Paraphaeosphaeria minitans TaxID=565426 RepID=A0A9P6GGR5_9PLEO|nr:hypothetical protein PMIN01_06524 [Paraphaeosphaeria minitans]